MADVLLLPLLDVSSYEEEEWKKEKCIIEEEEVSQTGSETGDCGKIENEAEAGGDCGTVVFTIGGKDIVPKDTVVNIDNPHMDDTALW